MKIATLHLNCSQDCWTTEMTHACNWVLDQVFALQTQGRGMTQHEIHMVSVSLRWSEN